MQIFTTTASNRPQYNVVYGLWLNGSNCYLMSIDYDEMNGVLLNPGCGVGCLKCIFPIFTIPIINSTS